MSFSNDTCDFCGSYIDGMGNDMKSTVTVNGVDMYWDGQCHQGMEGQWGRLALDEVDALQQAYQDAYDADPIDYDEPRKHKPTPEDYRRRGHQLYLMDTAWQLRAYHQHRKAQAE